MDAVRNPFAPGAGSQPPELAGRSAIIQDADTALQRAMLGRQSRSQVLLGLRGVGKTVLLNKIEQMAEGHGLVTSFLEAPEGQRLANMIVPKANQALQKLSYKAESKAKVKEALRALRSFASTVKINYGEFGLSVDPEPGVADSGNLEYDLADLFIRIGEAAKSAGRGWALLIDEVQYLTSTDFAALIVALHRASQRGLPIIFFGAGLPQVAALSGDAKSYAERLFAYPAVGPLDKASAYSAVKLPILEEGETIKETALAQIFSRTQGYPYFLQEWGYHTWNAADGSPISPAHVAKASEVAVKRLDEGFFKVRFERLTPKERDYVVAMAKLGIGPYRSSDVAEALDLDAQSLGPRRASIIAKGMIYSPAHGDIAFTVPMFEDYLKRNVMI
jgi:AAA ATPase domain